MATASKTQGLNYDLLIKPLVTEKSTSGLERNQYTFQVQPYAHKTELKQVFEALFEGRKVVSIQTVKMYSKTRRAGKKYVTSPVGKKAIFTISGEPIELIPGSVLGGAEGGQA